MVTISLCMIVRNEECLIGRCLESVKDIVDEIIIVDTGSEDMTKEIAREYTSNIYDFKWIDDFSAARNYSFSKATKEYIMWLDADDVILEDDRKKFIKLKEMLTSDIDIVMMRYNVAFDETGNVTLSYFRERMLKRAGNPVWKDPVHEFVCIKGKIANVDICITHKKEKGDIHRNLRIFEKLMSEGMELRPRNMFYYARELFYSGRHDEAIMYFNKFLDTVEGWQEDYISACIDLAKCYSIKNDKVSMLRSLLRSFEYDLPRAEICCQLGYYYKDSGDYKKAIYWFETALRGEKPEYNWGFLVHDCWGYIPCLELCVCYNSLGNIKKAVEYNEQASQYKPDDPAVLHNKRLFEQLNRNNPKG